MGEIWSYENSVEQYRAVGGTGRDNVRAQIALLKEKLMLTV